MSEKVNSFHFRIFRNAQFFFVLIVFSMFSLIIGMHWYMTTHVKLLVNYSNLPFYFEFLLLIIISLTISVIWFYRNRALMEKAYKTKSDEFESFFLSSLAMLCITDRNGCFHHLNPEWERSLGYSESELNGKKFIELVHPDDIKNTLIIAQEASEKEIFGFINRYRHKDGSYRWMEWRSYPVGDFVYASARDITEREKTLETLFESVEKFRIAFDNAPFGMSILQANDKNVAVNPELCKMFGYSMEELSIETLNGIIYSDDLSESNKWMEAIHPVCINEQTYEMQFTHREGHIVWGLMRTQWIYNKDNSLRMSIAHIHDITEKKKSEEKILKNEARLIRAQEMGNIGYSEHYITERKIWVTSLGMQIFGFPPQDGFIPLDDAIAKFEDLTPFKVAMDQLIKNDGKIELEYKIYPGEGLPPKYIHSFLELERDTKGKPYKFLSMFQDITDFKYAIETVKQSEQKYRLLFENMTNGFALHQMIYDDHGSPINFRYIEVNPAFEKHTGYDGKWVIGKTIKEVAPNMKDSYIQLFGKVAQTGEPLYYTDYIKDFDKFFDTVVFSPEKDKFAVIVSEVTERVNAEIKLKASEKKFMDIFNLSPNIIGISRIDDGTLLEINPSFTYFTGYSYKECINFKTEDLGLWSNPEERLRVVRILNEKGEVINIELNMTIKDGTIHMCFFSAKPIRYNDEKCLLFIINDVTELKNIEKALRLSEKKFSNIYNLSPDMVGITRFSDWVILDGNPALTKLTGYSPEEYVGKKSSDLGLWVHQEDRNTVIEVLNDKGVIKNREFQIRTKNGIVITCLFSANLMIYNDEVCILFVLNDISERKQYEEALQTRVLALTKPLDDPEEIKFADLFNLEDLQNIQDTFAEVSGVASIITYPDGKPITKPSRFCKLCTLIRNTEIGGRNCAKSDARIGCHNPAGSTIMPCLSGGLWDAGVSITLGGRHMANWLIGQVKNEAQVDDEILKYADVIGVDKEEFKQALKEVPVMSVDQFEKISHSFFLLANELSLRAYQNIQQARFIAEKDKAESEFRKLNETLENKVLERTNQLQQANGDLESFAYSISHDLRAPLRHIDGFTKLMYSKIEKPEEVVTGYFEKIGVASKRMAGMIDDLLSFSRLGRKALNLTEINLDEVIREIIDQMQPDLFQRKIHWMISSLPCIMADRSLIKIAFENLISNAVKYTGKKEEAIIEIGIHSFSNQKIEMYFKDNGVGFDMAYVGKLFGVFQRLHSAEEFEGTGIGLANVKQIITKHKGSIRAEGIPNEGATIFITLPK